MEVRFSQEEKTSVTSSAHSGLVMLTLWVILALPIANQSGVQVVSYLNTLALLVEVINC